MTVVPNNSVLFAFQNPVILRNIFCQISTDSTKHLELRLVNKQFNAVFLDRIRKSHRFLRISRCLVEDENTTSEGWKSALRIQQRIVAFPKVPNVEGFFRFLAEVVKVKIQTLRTDKLECVPPNQHKSLHASIVGCLLKNQTPTVFTGMYGICPNGCEDSIRLAVTAKVYGPLQLKVFERLQEEPCHFDELIIDELFLYNLANHTSELRETREECIEFMKQFIPRHLSLNQLCFQITEKSDPEPEEDEEDLVRTRPFPREIFEEMIKGWNVRSVRIEMQQYGSGTEDGQPYPIEAWESKEFFTPVYLDAPYHKTLESSPLNLLDKVEINVERAGIVFWQIMHHFAPEILPETYENLVENVRRIFPTKKIVLECPMGYGHLKQACFEGLLHTVFKDPMIRNSKTIVQYFPRFYAEAENVLDIPNSFDFQGRRLEVTVLQGSSLVKSEDPLNLKEYIGKTFRIKDSQRNYVVDLEIYMKANVLKEYQEKQRAKETSILTHYLL